MKEVITRYTCDVCGKDCDRHFKVKVPNNSLKKWKRFDMCDNCYAGFYNLCNFNGNRNKDNITMQIVNYVHMVELEIKTIDDIPSEFKDIVSTIIAKKEELR